MTGPNDLRVMRGFTFDARFASPGLANGVASDLVPFTKVRVLLLNSLGRAVVDEVVEFPAAATEVPLSFDVPLSPSAPASGEAMSLALQYVNAQGDTVFRGGPLAVTVAPTVPGSPPPPVPEIRVVYAGQGANATLVTISVNVDTVLAGNSFTYTAVARDAQGTVLPNTPIAWRSETPAKATVTNSGSGAGSTLPSRGPALIVAQLLSAGAQADTVLLEILPRAQSIAVVSGNNQTASFGAPLAQPLVVQVNATDGLAMAGVPVSYAVTSGGGAVSAASVLTGTDGRAQVTWTAGNGLGAQSVSATSTGLTGSPLTFTATAPLTQLVHHYPFTTGADDAVGTANATLLAGATVADGLLSLDGSTGYAEFASAIVPTSGSYTVTFFVRNRGSLTQATSFVSQGQAGGPGFVMGYDATGQLRIGEGLSATGQGAVSGDGIFHQVAIVVDSAAGNTRFYVDGQQLQVQNTALATSTSGTPTRLGRAFGANGEFLAGEMDEVRIHRGALTTAAVQALYGAGVTAPDRLAFVSVPTQVTVNEAASPFTVRVTDALGRLRTGYTGAVTVAIDSNPGAATLGGTTTVNAVGGVATFGDLTFNNVGIGFTLVASADGITSATSPGFTVNLGPQIFWTNTSGGNWSNPANWSEGRVPVETDRVFITQAGTYTVTVDANTSVAQVIVGAVNGTDTQTLVVNRATLTLLGTSTLNSGGSVRERGVLLINGGGEVQGTKTVLNSGTLRFDDGRFAPPLNNNGLLLVRGPGTVSGALTTSATSLIRVQSNGGFGPVGLAVSNGFTNNGVIELVNAEFGYDAGIAVSTGTLVNAVGATIVAPVGAGGNRFIDAQVDNRGTMSIQAYTFMNRTGAAHLNSGSIDLPGSLQLGLPGGGSFINTGTITIGASASLALGDAGTFTHQSGATLTGGSLLTAGGVTTVLNGAHALDGFLANTGTLTLGSGVTSNFGTMSLVDVTVNGAGSLAIADTVAATITRGTVSVPMSNAGAVVVYGAATVAGGLTSAVGSTINVVAEPSTGAATLTVTGGFTNRGLLQLQSATSALAVGIAVPSATLVNASEGTLRTLVDAGGARTITGSLTNAGTLEVAAGGAGVLTVTGGFTNSGVLTMQLGGATAGTQYDQLAVSGTATLGGTLNVGLFNAYAPPPGASFALVNAGAVSGTFATTNLAAGLQAAPTYGATSVSVNGLSLVVVNAWATGVSGTWSTAANWSLGRTPAATDSVVIAATGTYTVTMDVGDTLAALVLGGSGASPTLTTGTRTLRVNGPVDVLTGATLTIPAGGQVTGTAGTAKNAGTVVLNGTFALPLRNDGLLRMHGASLVSGALTTGDTTSVIEVRSSAAGGGGASVTISSGFTNTGRLEFVTTDAFYGNGLTMPNGTLTNAPSGIIRSVTGFGGKTLAARLDNQGLLDVREALTLNRASTAHTNSGTVALVSADLSIVQSGTTPSFTNTGTITVPSGRTLSVQGGTLDLSAGLLDGPSGTLSTNGTTVLMSPTTARTRFTLANSTVSTPYTIAAGDSLRLVGGSPTMTLTNNGRLLLASNVVLGGTLTTGDTTSVIEVRASNVDGGGVAATITNGFTNTGRIEFITRDAFYGNSLTVTNGTLTNAPTGIIRTVAGFGGKQLSAQLSNQGLLDLREQLTLDRVSSAHTNSGTISLVTGNFSVGLGGTTPSFTNTGTIDIPSGRTWSVSGGTLTLTGGVVNGQAGSLSTNGTTLNFAIGEARTRLILANTTVPGTFTIPAGDSLRLHGGSPTMTLVNNGRLVLQSNVVLGGTVTTGDTTSVIEVRASNSAEGGVAATITNGFTNTGRIELVTRDAFYGNSLTVTNGTLTNAPTGIIRTVAGFGGKTLAAQLNNQGLVEMREALSLQRASATHVNSGTINLALADLGISQSGTTPSFSNTGTITVPSGRTLSVTGGTLNLTGGLLDGASGALQTNSVTLNFTLAESRTRLTLTNTTVPGTFTIPAGDSLRLVGGSPTMTLVNNGRLVLASNVVLGGTLTTGDTTSVIEVRSSNADGGGASATITNGFTNTGRIELVTRDAFYGNSLTVTNGTLTNAPTGIIRTVAGFGGKTLAAQLNNQGLVDLREALSLNRASAAHLNSGTITLALGDLGVSQSGTTPSFSNTGTITVPVNRTFSVSGGTLTLNGGTLDAAAGTLATSGTTLNFGIAESRARLVLSNTTVPGTFTIPAGDSLRLVGGSPTMTLVNNGRLVLASNVVLGGTLTTGDTTSVVEVRSSNADGGGASATITNGFTNTGRIELVTRDAFYGNSLTVTNGTLTNAPTGIIRSIAGFGGKTLAAPVDNQGLFDVRESLTLSGLLNQRSLLTVTNGTTLNVTGLLTLFTGSTTTVNGTLTKTGTCVNNGGTIAGTAGFTCP